jgi:hypothetical protein
MKTDPKACDYQLEYGASRNYEPWREQEKVCEQDFALGHAAHSPWQASGSEDLFGLIGQLLVSSNCFSS